MRMRKRTSDGRKKRKNRRAKLGALLGGKRRRKRNGRFGRR